MSTDPPAGLCASCRHVRRVENRRGSVFFLCRRSRSDDRFPRYPRIPVRRCPGYEEAEAPESESRTAPDGARQTDGAGAADPGPDGTGER